MVLIALIAACLVASAVLYVWLQERTEERLLAEQRSDVVQSVQVFANTYSTFRPKDAEAYVDRVRPLLTTRRGAEFRREADALVADIVQRRFFSKGKVMSGTDGLPLIAVSSMSLTSAEALVAMEVKQVAEGAREIHEWQWRVRLSEVGGTWLVDSFEEV